MRKIIYILQAITLALFFTGCGNEEPKYTIPASPVNFVINTNFLDNNLKNTGSFNTYLKLKDKASYEKLVTNVKGIQVLSGERAASAYGNSYIGYSGLLIVNTGSTLTPTPFAAFDLCCPYEGMAHIRIVPTNEGTAKCPECNSVYDIIFGTGIPKSGPAIEKKTSLQSYYVTALSQSEFRIHYREN